MKTLEFQKKIKIFSVATLVTGLIAGFFVLSCTKEEDEKSSAAKHVVSVENKKKVLSTYADIAEKSYKDALDATNALKTKITAFTTSPNPTTLQEAKDEWIKARESYSPTEIFRLSEGPIDAESGWVKTMYGALEAQINAWPLDENMIDYTQQNSSASRSTGNIIDTAGSFTPSGTGATAVDITTITKAKLTALNENGGEANVSTGYHAIEFLLWGQDQDYTSFKADTITNGAMVAGQRPHTDYTTDTNKARRIAYLNEVTDKLVEDLEKVGNAWKKVPTPDCTTGVGCYRAAFLGELTGTHASKNIDTDKALKQVMIGMGMFIKSELANERIAVSVLTPSEEDEHSCFSDNTHRDILQNYKGFEYILKGDYKGTTPVTGTGMLSLISSGNKSSIETLLTKIEEDVNLVDTTAKSTMHFDYQIQTEKTGNKVTEIKRMKNNMRDLGDKMVSVAQDFGISITTTDVTDSEETQI